MKTLISKIASLCLFLSLSFISYAQVAEWISPDEGTGTKVCMDQFNNSFTCGQFVGTTTIGTFVFTSAGAQDVMVEKHDASGNLLWATPVGGAGGEFSQSIVYDGYGAVWVTGQFSGTMNAGSFVLTSAGGTDAFLVKMDATNGAVLFAESGGGTSTDYGMDLAADPSGNVYFSGIFNNNFSFGSTVISGGGSYDIFMLKLDNFGNVLWDGSITGPNIESMWSITVDDNDNLYVAGFLSSSSSNFNGTVLSYGVQTHFVVKFDNTGAFDWIATSEFNGEIYGLSVDANENVYFTGNYDTQAIFGPFTLTGGANDDIILVKVNNDGTYSWAQSYGGSGTDEGYDLDCTPQGDLFVTGSFQGIFSFGTTNLNAGSFSKSYVAKLDSAGNVIWVQQTSGSSSHVANGIATNDAGDIYFTGSGSGSFNMSGNSATLISSFLVKMADNANIISGTVFQDASNDGIMDSGEPGIPNVILQLDSGPYVTASNNSGIYNMYSTAGSHSVSIPSPPLYYNFTTPAVQNFNFTGMGNIDTANLFGLYAIPNINDLRVDITPVSNPKAGYVLSYLITYTNVGTNAINATVTLQSDPNLVYIMASPVPTTQAGQTTTWDLGLLMPGVSGSIHAQLNVPSTMMIGDPLNSSAEITPIAGDSIPSDNTSSNVVNVTAPYDPNYKEVSIDTLYDITGSDWLEYVIHFQNVGNDTAYNVIILDTLSAYLDLSTFEIMASTHQPLNFAINNGNIAAFTFNNIMLPDSTTDPIGSMGFVKYRVKYLSSLPLFESILNVAGIYFDYNSAIITNTASTYHSTVNLSVDENSEISTISIYPNPASNEIHIMGISSGLVEIYDLTGRVVYSNQMQSTIDVSDLNKGIYILVIRDQNGNILKTQKQEIY